MRKLVMTSIVALLAMSGLGWSAPAPKATGGVGYTGTTGEVKASFVAQGDIQTAKGNVNVRGFEFGGFTGTVTCYSQSDNSATFSGPIDGSVEHFSIRVVDNGEGAKAEPDTIAIERFLPPVPTGLCLAPVLAPPHDIEKGNIQVHRR